MTKDNKYVPYSESKTREERIAYVKANPDKYKPYNQWLEEKKKHESLIDMEKRVEILEKYINALKQ